MFWVLLIVLFNRDPANPPDTIAKSFTTEQACTDARESSMDIVRKADAGYAAAGFTCTPVSNPATQRSADK